MDKLTALDKWPDVPPELKYSDLRLPGTFRELVANRNLTHEEIGRIVRCIALNTEVFMTPRIEPDVHFYTAHQKLKLQVKKRVAALRKRRKDMLGTDASNAKNCVTVTHAEKQPVPGMAALSPIKKTPSIKEEKKPPIVPLEKKNASPLEKKNRKTKKEAMEDRLQQDLFSLAASTCSSGIEGNGQKTALEGSAQSAANNVLQDIESDPSPEEGQSATMPTASDSRTDAAWIPARFAVFWEKYPKKVAKQAAMKSFSRLIKSQGDIDQFMRTLMASLEWWSSQPNWKRDAGKFIPHPATWLNRGSWEDSVDNSGRPQGQAEFLGRNSDSDDDLIRRMTGG